MPRVPKKTTPAVACVHEPNGAGMCMKCGTWTGWAGKKPSAEKRTRDMFATTRKEASAARGVLACVVWARPLVTLHVGDDVSADEVRDAIVRIVTRAADEDHVIEAYRDKIAEYAASVAVLPKPKGEVLPEQKVQHVRARSVREVVMRLADESAFEDKEALRGFCEDVMAKEGL